MPPLVSKKAGPTPIDGKLRLPLKFHGGKNYLAKKIVALMPEHLHYVEPFVGGAAVLLAHTGVGRSELINDIDKDLTNFWRVLQDKDMFQDFVRRCDATPLSRCEFERAGIGLYEWRRSLDPVTIAWSFFIRCRQSLAGRMDTFTPPTRARLRREMNGNVSEWLGAVEGLPEVHARLRRVFVENLDALKLISREDTPDTLFYCDPPYLHETRSSTDVYAHEMTEEQHEAMLEVLLECQGKVMLSGYASPMYDTALRGWKRHVFNLPNNAAGGEKKQRKTEVLWCNF